MKRLVVHCMALVSLAFLVTGCAAGVAQGPTAESRKVPGAATEEALVKPFAHADGSPFRVAVVQSGDYFAYNDVFESIYNGLTDLGWTGKVVLSPAEKVTVPMMLAAYQAKGGTYLSFDPLGYVDLNWTEETEAPQALRNLLEGRGNADLVISLGTLAGTFAAKISSEGKLKVPVMVESVSDPLGSKIISSFADSGHELITSSSDPLMYDRQIRFFHKVVGFKKLGLIYTDTETGRAYAALPTVTKASQDLGFSIVPDTEVMEDPPNPADIPKAEAAYVAALERLAPKIDAVYLAIQAGLTDASLPAILEVAYRHKLPTFIMEGSNFVWKGTLFGESASLLAIEGLYSARKLSRVLKGEKLRFLPQSNPHMPHIAVNLATARKIGFDVPIDVLLGADDVYTDFMPVPVQEVKK
ncbi:MAG: ABC transporter substrate-binding protein [Rectinemataceae bacterium]